MKELDSVKEMGSGVVQTTAAYWLRAMHQPLIVDATQLAGAAEHDTVVWDVRSTRHHQADNRQGAVSIGQIDWLLADPGGTTLVDSDVIARVLRRIGIGPGRAVIVYADRAASAGFLALRALRAIGVERARVYLGAHGGATSGTSALQAFWRSQAMRHPARALVSGGAPSLDGDRKQRLDAQRAPGERSVADHRAATDRQMADRSLSDRSAADRRNGYRSMRTGWDPVPSWRRSWG